MLTEEQRQLVTQWHGLIISFAIENKISYDEWYDVLAIALCNAARIYDSGKGYAFQTLAFECMRHAMRRQWKIPTLKRSIPRELLCSYNTEVVGRHGHTTELIETIDSPYNQQRLDVTAVEVKQFRDSLSELHRFVFDSLMEGRKEVEIAKEIGYTKGGVSFIRQKIKQQWRDYCAA